MPTAKSRQDSTEPTPQQDEAAVPAAESASDAPAATDPPAGPEPGVYEYVHTDDCVYPHVPLTARAARSGRPATDDEPGEPAVDATVFDWPFGPPDDGRWKKTRKTKPNQAADNAGPLISEE
ncbi:hypothetical protein AB0N17_02930 [Streptomyces sp. NPDC051133]|uniref:hypothetical protein n=1 Tax=Streptomyces sp. NPDC051133 TaxID=3155521 RepID=UPI003429DA76